MEEISKKAGVVALRVLLLHCDYIEYQVKQRALKEAEALDAGDEKPKRVDEPLVIFATVEKRDESDPTGVAEKTAGSIADTAERIKAKKVVLYPYAHLSSELGRPAKAVEILKRIESGLRERGYDVTRAKFGWYKSFELRCKGHPLSELSRSISVDERAERGRVEAAPEVIEKGELIILEPSGKEHPLDLSHVEDSKILQTYPDLKQFVISEEVGKVSHESPPHVRLMRKLELVDYEPASDIGHFRFYPKGALLKELLEEYAGSLAVRELHAVKIETPLLYRADQPDIAGQVERFRERNYHLYAEDKELILRFAGDFGLFRMIRDATVSYKQLPLRVYELSPSFRLEREGECVGLKRLRAFTMPDIHCFCKDLAQGMEEYEELLRYYTKLADSMEVDYVVAFRVVKDFYTKNKDWFAKLLQIVRKPALFELLPEMKHYWVVKHEFQTIDSVGGNAQLSTVQLDVEDSERYSIFYTDATGAKKGCTILHSSVGSIERWIYALLEQAEKAAKENRAPMLPVWLSPTQVRVIPISPDQLEYANKTMRKIGEKGVRVDLDDREQTVSSKIRDAETEWIPYIVVVGKAEEAEKNLSVRLRITREQKQMKLDELASRLMADIGEKPRLPLYLPERLSMRPKFL